MVTINTGLLLRARQDPHHVPRDGFTTHTLDVDKFIQIYT